MGFVYCNNFNFELRRPLDIKLGQDKRIINDPIGDNGAEAEKETDKYAGLHSISFFKLKTVTHFV